MKKLIFCFLLSLVTASGYAQKADWYFGVPESTARQLADSIAYNAKGSFVFIGLVQLSNLETHYTFRYVEHGTEKDLDPHYIDVWFNKVNGAYDFVHVTTLFEDIFPFYQKFIDPAADSAQMQSKYSKGKIIPWTAERNVRCHLGSDQGLWKLKAYSQSVQPVYKSGHLNSN